MAYYKIVRTDIDGDYLSFAVPERYKEFCVRYPIGEFAYPVEGSKLFAFEFLADAANYWQSIWGSKDFHIFECEVVNPTQCYYIADFLFVHDKEDLIKYWQDKSVAGMRVPRGTVACDAIKLVKEIKL